MGMETHYHICYNFASNNYRATCKVDPDKIAPLKEIWIVSAVFAQNCVMNISHVALDK